MADTEGHGPSKGGVTSSGTYPVAWMISFPI